MRNIESILRLYYGDRPENNLVAQSIKELITKAENLPISGVSDLLNNRLQWMLDEMDKLPPFKQSFNNLNERHGKLLSAKKLLEREGII